MQFLVWAGALGAPLRAAPVEVQDRTFVASAMTRPSQPGGDSRSDLSCHETVNRAAGTGNLATAVAEQRSSTVSCVSVE